MELEDRKPIINISPDTSYHENENNATDGFQLEESRNRKKGSDILPYYDELNRLLGLIKAQKECVDCRAGENKVCISFYNDMMRFVYLGSAKNILPIAQLMLCILVSQYAQRCCLLPN